MKLCKQKWTVFGTMVLFVVLAVACSGQPTAVPTSAFDMPSALDRYLSSLPDGFGTITPVEMKERMSSPLFIVDLREAKDFSEGGYIQGSVNIPVRTFMKNLDKLPAKDQPIIITCGSGQRSALGMQALQLLGYTNVKSLAGGLAAWKSANLPLATGAPLEPKAGPAPDVNQDLRAALDKFFSNLPDGWGSIPPGTLKDVLASSKPLQIDVREAKEVSSDGFIAGSTNLPLRTLVQNRSKLPPDKGAMIATECSDGHRSAMAMMALSLLGYTNVRNLAGGLNAWSKAGLPLSK